MRGTSDSGQAARVTIPSADLNPSTSPKYLLLYSSLSFCFLITHTYKKHTHNHLGPSNAQVKDSSSTYASEPHYLIYASLSQCIIPIYRAFTSLAPNVHLVRSLVDLYVPRNFLMTIALRLSYRHCL